MTAALPHRIEEFHQSVDQISTKIYLTARDIYQEYLDAVVALANSEIGYLHLFDEETEEIELNVWSHEVLAKCASTAIGHYPLRSAGIWADCVRKRRVVVHNDYKNEASVEGLPDGHFPIFRHMGTPVFANDSIVAIIGIGNAEVPYDDEISAAVSGAIQATWPVISNALDRQSNKRVTALYDFQYQSPTGMLTNMIGAIGRALEARDEYTAHHQTNVAYIAEAIGTQMGLSKDMKFGLNLGALIHDIGKIAIPAELLNKPSRLMPAEQAMVRTHTETGADFFSDLDLPWPIVDIIRQHHERVDGSGYPQGLKGEAICLEARIVAVADTFDAMASDRPYRHAIGTEGALEVLNNGRGTWYDPYVVDAFLRAMDADPTFGGRYLPRDAA